jgi:hypothetical protein
MRKTELQGQDPTHWLESLPESAAFNAPIAGVLFAIELVDVSIAHLPQS